MAMANAGIAVAVVPHAGRQPFVFSSRTSSAAPCFFGKRKNGIGFARLHAIQAMATAESVSTDKANTQQTKQFHFLVANAKFMLDEEEHLQELLRERLRNYKERNKEQDFWIVIEPKFLSEKFPHFVKRINRPAVALVSTDPTWITYMKLRLDRVLKGSYEAVTLTSEENSTSDVELPETPWNAPYPKYQSGWWTLFLPPVNSNQ